MKNQAALNYIEGDILAVWVNFHHFMSSAPVILAGWHQIGFGESKRLFGQSWVHIWNFLSWASHRNPIMASREFWLLFFHRHETQWFLSPVSIFHSCQDATAISGVPTDRLDSALWKMISYFVFAVIPYWNSLPLTAFYNYVGAANAILIRSWQQVQTAARSNFSRQLSSAWK